MAEQHIATYSDKPLTDKQKEKDFAENQNTFHAFMGMTKWSVISIAILLILMYVFLVA